MIFICLALIAALAFALWLHHKDRQDWTRERRLLVTRIQSPELAPMLAPRPDDEDEEVPLGARTELEEIRALVHGENGDGE